MSDILSISTFNHYSRILKVVAVILDVVELDLIGSDDVDGHNHLVISD